MVVSPLKESPSAQVSSPDDASSSVQDLKKVIWDGIDRFTRWLERSGYASHDPYDVWGTRYGSWSRKIYYQRGKLGLPFIAPVLLLETLWPSARRWLVKKKRFATADGQLVLAFLNLKEATGDGGWLKKASALGEELMGYSVPGYRGHCWGYPFDWQNNRAFWPKNTPYITCTPYCYEAFLQLHGATGDPKHLERVASIAEFVASDLRDTPIGPDAFAGSYSPIDNSKVVNASAYRAFVLFDAGERFGREDYIVKARGNLRFILDNQREDGAWLYSLDVKGGAFIDHFHTCFVLKNLFKLNQRLKSEEVCNAIRKGYDYYRRSLFDSAGEPRYFAVEPRFQLVRLEMYNYAEAITLGALLGDESPGAFTMAAELATRLIERHQLPEGHFVTRVFRGGLRHTFPFLRWPQAQLFYALTNLLSACEARTSQYAR
jgi:hypothetical protein